MERRGDLGVVTKGVFAELAMERRGVFAVLGVSKMREELGEGQSVEDGVQNTWRDGLLVIVYYPMLGRLFLTKLAFLWGKL